jgi:hypothetical protein
MIYLNDAGAVTEGNGRLAVHHTAAAGAVDIDVYKVWWWFFKKVLSLAGVTNGQSASEDVDPGTYYARIRPSGSNKKLFFDRVPVPPSLYGSRSLRFPRGAPPVTWITGSTICLLITRAAVAAAENFRELVINRRPGWLIDGLECC